MTVKTQTTNATNNEELEAVVTSHLAQDLKNSVLIVSIVINLFIVTLWLALQLTSQYDSQLASFLFSR